MRGLRALLEQGQRALANAGSRRALPVVAEGERDYNPELEDLIGDLSPTMRTAVMALYRMRSDGRGRIRYRGTARRPTVQALRDRGLLKFWGNGSEFIKPTDLGEQVARELR